MSVLPQNVIHADWSVSAEKRWLVRAQLTGNGCYRVEAPELVPPITQLIEQLMQEEGTVLFGLDLPIGLPLAYAQQIACTDFVSWLRQLPADAPFYDVAERLEEISVARPFYPKRAGGTRQQHLLDGLRVNEINQLRRQCEWATTTGRAAAPLFWTMGAQQVGKAAIVGWRELINPLLCHTQEPVGIWPFDGQLTRLFSAHRVVLAEAYPAEFYKHLGVYFRPMNGRKWGKRIQTDRQVNGQRLRDWAVQKGIALELEMETFMITGFGDSTIAEDQFDATVGVLGMLNVVLNHCQVYEPKDAKIREIEGWMLGMKQTTTSNG